MPDSEWGSRVVGEMKQDPPEVNTCHDLLHAHQEVLNAHHDTLDADQDDLNVHHRRLKAHQEERTSDHGEVGVHHSHPDTHQDDLNGRHRQLNTHQEELNDDHGEVNIHHPHPDAHQDKLNRYLFTTQRSQNTQLIQYKLCSLCVPWNYAYLRLSQINPCTDLSSLPLPVVFLVSSGLRPSLSITLIR